MTENFRTFETETGGRKLIVEVGKYCEQSNGSCVIRCGDTVVLTNVTMSAEIREGLDYFPLGVDFEEKMYAVGRIPGGFKKKGRKAERQGNTCFPSYRQAFKAAFPQGIF